MSDRNPVRGAFRQFQYPTAPLSVGDDYKNRVLAQVMATMIGDREGGKEP